MKDARGHAVKTETMTTQTANVNVNLIQRKKIARYAGASGWCVNTEEVSMVIGTKKQFQAWLQGIKGMTHSAYSKLDPKEKRAIYREYQGK